MTFDINNAPEIELSTVITDIAAGPFGSNLKVSCFVPDGFPIIDGANLKGYKVTDNITKFVTDEKAHSLERSIAHRGDVVSTISGTLGQIAYIPNDSKYEGYLCSQRQFRITFDPEKVYVPYIVFYFHTREGQHKILSFASQVGVPALAQPLKNFRKIRMRLPDLKTQKQIACIVESINEKVDHNNRIKDNLELQAAATFRNMFITNADPSWKKGTISDLGTVVGGSTPSKANPEYYTDHGIAWITPKDLSVDKSKFISHGADDITELGLKNSSASIMPRGTVLFSSRAPIGYIAIADGDVTTNQGFKSVVPNKNIGTPYVYYFLKNALPTIESMASGSTFKEISGSAMRTVPASIPDCNTLQQFSSFCDPLFAKQRILEKQNRELMALLNVLLPKLMSGKIDVSKITT